MELIRRIVAGAFGGATGGALVGLAEAGVIASAGGEEYWAFVFGSVAYGLIGAAAGAGWGFVSTIFPFDKTSGMTMGTAAGFVGAGLGFVVARFRVIRDVFAESLILATPTGLVVHLGLLAVAAILFLVLRRALGGAAERRGAASTGMRWFGGLVALGVLLGTLLTFAVGGAPAVVPTAATASGPNVVLVIVDTLRADRLGAYGGTRVATPNIDALAKDSVVFDNAFANSSWTRPAIATILTGLYPASHKVMHKTDLLPDAVSTIAEVMGEGGYRTAGFVTNINVAPSFNFQQGFDSFSYLSPAFFFGATDSGAKLSLYSGMRLVRERFLSNKKYVQNYYQDAETVNGLVLPWVDDSARDPFFALVHYMDPHDPYFDIPYDGRAVARVDTPNPAPERAEELAKLYDSNVAYLDRFVGDLVGVLKSSGVYEDTVIAFVSDHGEEFYEHKGWWHGTTLYDEQIHVPLFFKLEKSQHAGTRVPDLAAQVDIAPTLAATAGLGVPTGMQGRDLFGNTKVPEMIYAEEDHEGNDLESVRSLAWKLVLANPGNPRRLEAIELYDLNEDPGETYNLAAFKKDRVAKMTESLAALRLLAGSNAVSGSSGEIDPAVAEKLKSLGYSGD